MNQIEIWKPIKDYEGLYEVSDLGRVFGIKKNKILKQFLTHRGYLQIQLCKDSRAKLCRPNRLVAQAFIPNPENKPEVNHKNGMKMDNRVANLEWATTSENIQHAYDTGLKKSLSGANNPRSKPVYQFNLNGEFVKKYAALKEAARMNGYSTIINIRQCCEGLCKQRYGYIWSYKETIAA